MVRDIARTGQRDSWPLLKQGVQGYVSQAGTLSGIGALPTPRRLEVLPYTVARNETRDYGTSRAAGRYTHPSKLTAGADVKYGLSSDLTLDATINPDFGEVEADPAQLNLTAFETFFNERRPFFLEGAVIFTFNTSCGDIDSNCTGLFYSRRIGRNPQLSGNYGDETSLTATPIAAAGKLTGRLANGVSVGLLDAVTQRLGGIGSVAGLPTTIEPRTNYSVLRGWLRPRLRGVRVVGRRDTRAGKRSAPRDWPTRHRRGGSPEAERLGAVPGRGSAGGGPAFSGPPFGFDSRVLRAGLQESRAVRQRHP